MPSNRYHPTEFTPYTPTFPGDKVFMDRLMVLCQEQLSNPTLQIEDLCDSLAVSKSTLYRKIKAISGLSPNQFIRKVRLLRAASLLSEGYGSVTEVVYEVGFNSPSYFSRCFQEEFGQTPSVYVKELSFLPTFSRPITRFFGRENELVGLNKLIQQARLITLSGPGGSGKTRLATELIAQNRDSFVNEVVFVSLAPLHEPDLVLPTIASTLRIPDTPKAPLRETVIRHLADKSFLLLLDNFEHLTEAAPDISILLKACPNLRVIITSRTTLHIEGEHEYPVEPLPFPPTHTDDIQQFPAVQLFIDRARAVNPHFLTESDENAAILSAICRRLDGLPLALELAAAKVKTFSLPEILAQLDRHVDLLKNGPIDKDSRHQSLSNCIRWSYELLSQPQQDFFSACATFAGEFTFDAACKIIGDSLSYEPVDQLLSALLASSLLQRKPGESAESRYYLLTTIKEFARQRLKESDHWFKVFSAHARYYQCLAKEAEPYFTTEKQNFWLNKVEADIDNIRGALSWFYDRQQAENGLVMVKALMRFWIIRSGAKEGRNWVVKFLTIPSGSPNSRVRADVLFSLGVMESQRCVDLNQCVQYLKESISIFDALDQKKSLADALNHLGWIKSVMGKHQEARKYTREARAFHEALDNKRGISVSMMNLGWQEELEGNFHSAQMLYTDCCRLRQEIGDERGWAYTQSHFATLEYQQGYYSEAQYRLKKVIDIFTQLKDYQLLAYAKTHLGILYYYLTKFERAEQLLKQSKELWLKVDNRWGSALADSFLSLVYLRLLRPSLALPLLSSALESWEKMPEKYGRALCLYGLGTYWLMKSEVEVAYRYSKQSLLLRAKLMNRLGVAESAEQMAEIALKKNKYSASAMALGKSEDLRNEISAPRSPLDQRIINLIHEAVCSNSTEKEYLHWMEEGKALSCEALLSRMETDQPGMP